MKILTIIGARPQFIKAGSISREIANNKSIEEVIVHTGQHFDQNMSDIFFDQMKMPKPNYNLKINGLSHGAMTGEMIKEIEKILIKEKPNWVLVYGDTNSTLAGALAASKLYVKIVHVEAGLRSFNMNMPEEINRIITDRLSTILFCPTDTAISNLKKEGYNDFNCKLVKSGDVMQDGAIFYKKIAKKPNINIKKKFILSTIHRAENTNDINRLKNIIGALNQLSEKQQIILPLHPRTKKVLEDNEIEVKATIIKPVGYLEMIWLISNSSLIMTDSGGLQKEAFFFEKHCLTLRDETEWVELVENGYNVLVGADKDNILNQFNDLSSLNHDFDIDLYGKGKASSIIINEILNH